MGEDGKRGLGWVLKRFLQFKAIKKLLGKKKTEDDDGEGK